MNENRVVFSCVSYLLILGILLQMAAIPGAPAVNIPTSPVSDEESATQTQSFGTAVLECSLGLLTGGIGVFLSLFGLDVIDCDQETTTQWFSPIQPGIDTLFSIFSFAFGTVAFLFQMLTYQIPGIPTWLNSILILPPAIVLAWVGLNYVIRRGTGGGE